MHSTLSFFPNPLFLSVFSMFFLCSYVFLKCFSTDGLAFLEEQQGKMILICSFVQCMIHTYPVVVV